MIRDDCIMKGPRIYKRVYGVLFTCSTTRAVHLDVALDYGTESVLQTIRRLMANKGDIRQIVSNPGSQLQGAAKELSEWRKNWDPDLERTRDSSGVSSWLIHSIRMEEPRV